MSKRSWIFAALSVIASMGSASAQQSQATAGQVLASIQGQWCCGLGGAESRLVVNGDTIQLQAASPDWDNSRWDAPGSLYLYRSGDVIVRNIAFTSVREVYPEGVHARGTAECLVRVRDPQGNVRSSDMGYQSCEIAYWSNNPQHGQLIHLTPFRNLTRAR